MNRVKFGLYERGKFSGADIAVRVMQICAILPAIFTFIVPGYLSLLTRRNFFSTLFDLGISALPRAFTSALSYFYRLTSSEVALHFAILVCALAFGLIMNGLLRGKPRKGFITRVIFAVLILADLVIRLLPFHFNRVLGLPINIIGFVVRLACLALVVMDIVAAKRNEKEEVPDTDN